MTGSKGRTRAQDRARRRQKRRIAADLWQAIWRYRKQTLGAAALMIVAKLAGVSVPLVLRSIVRDVQKGTDSIGYLLCGVQMGRNDEKSGHVHESECPS